MNFPTQKQIAAPGSAEETLRLIAGLSPPQGLEERVHTALLTSPRRGRVLLWPAALRMDSNWMRSAAAAAIVFVVAGGGWGIYSWVQPQPARVIAQPPHVAAPGGFSSAGAMRTPNTLNGPVLAHPVTAAKKQAKPAAQKPNRRAPSGRAGKAAVQHTDQAAAPAAK